MELYQLRGFAVVAELGHLTRAAERLHISQPALSAQIKALEDELGVDLFRRSSTGMVLTPAGQRLLPEAEKVLAAAEGLRGVARSMKGKIAGQARIGTVSDPAFIRIGEFLSLAVERYPLLQIELHQEVSGEAYEQVRSGELDATFYFGALTHPGVTGLALRELVYRVVAPAAWKDRIAAAGWTELASMPWIMTPSISTHNQLVSQLFRDRAVAPTQVVVADQEAVISSLVVSGVGLALMREDLALEKAGAGEVCLWGDARVATQLWFLHPAERVHDPIIVALVDVLQDVWELRDKAKAATRRVAKAG
jgi:DNA-binding transcriptional LysR family regulator